MNQQQLKLSSGTALRALLISGVVLLASCGGEEPEEPATVSEAPAVENDAAPPAQQAPAPEAEPTSPGLAADEPAAAAPAGDLSGKTAPSLTELGNEPVAAAELHDALYHWDGETIEIAAYPALNMSRGYWSSRMQLGMGAEPKAPVLGECEFTDHPQGTIKPGTPLLIRGTVARRSFAVGEGNPPKIVLSDCELISSEQPLPESSDPWNLGSGTILLGDLHEAAFGWLGETVQVEGYYHGSTHSSASDVTRHDLKPDARGKVGIGCNQAGQVEAPRSAVQERAGVVVEGSISTIEGNTITLDDCSFVNRS